MVLSRAVLRDLYTQDQAASKIGYVTMGMALVPMIAPAVGGAIEQDHEFFAGGSVGGRAEQLGHEGGLCGRPDFASTLEVSERSLIRRGAGGGDRGFCGDHDERRLGGTVGPAGEGGGGGG